MYSEAKHVKPWDLADPKTMRSNFSSESFYIVIDGLDTQAVRQAASIIKASLKRTAGIRMKGPLALPTVRRRHVILRELKTQDSNGMYCANAKRIRNVLLVMNPTSEAIASLISLSLPNSINAKIESYESQYDLKDDTK
jgi:ribosomal protein S10